jgi:nucleoid DNA-binding protein
MNKSDLIDAVAGNADLSKASAGRAVEAVLGGIGDALGNGDSVSLVGFGTFSVRHRKAREGRNPSTQQPMHIPESKVPGFKAGKGLKDKVKAS